MFRKKVASPSVQPEGIVELTLPVSISEAASASAAFEVADPIALNRSPDARLYLVLSEAVDRDGLADEWQFHYLFPSLQAEAALTVRSAATSSTKSGELHVRMTQLSAPGSAEHAMAEAGGPYMKIVMEQKWGERVERIAALSRDFIDSPAAVDEICTFGRDLFTGGPIRLKGRTLPGGQQVWEVSTVEFVFHSPFRADS